MKKVVYIFLFVLVGGAFSQMAAQSLKIGYTDVEVLLNYLPETKTIEKEIQEYTKKLEEELMIKQKALQSDYEIYMEKGQAGDLSPNQAKAWEQKLQKQQQEIQKDAQQAENKLLQKRAELLRPVEERVNTAIKEVAEEQKYTYVLNKTSSNLIPSILYGVEQSDITIEIAKKLGIEIPENAGTE